MQKLSARLVVVVLCLSLLVFGVPARSRAVDEVFTFSATDPTSGASGQFFFQYDANGELVFINGYASTSDWSASMWWSPSGGWQFGTVIFSDPDLGNLASIRIPAARTIRGRTHFSRGLIEEEPPPDYPTDPPIVPGQKTCTECVGDKRSDCNWDAAAAIAGATTVAVGVAYACGPPATVGAPPSAGLTIASCAVVSLGTLGTGYWIAKRAQKKCYQDALDTCIDPNNGKTCRQNGWT
jgi:hypothetical protein